MSTISPKKTLKPLIILIAVIFVTTLHFFSMSMTMTDRKPYIINWNWTQTISCHYSTEDDGLPSAEGLDPPENFIFFHETSCRGGMTSRQACSVESAARNNPNRQVYVFFNSPVSERTLSRSGLAKLVNFKNVKLVRLHTIEYAKGTALEKLLADKKNNQSSWRIEHTADMLRYITMYRYGGLYLDTDTLVVRSLDPLGSDWAALEDDQMVNVAAFSVSKSGVGHQLVTTILNDLESNFEPDHWTDNGPGAMTRALLDFCNTTVVLDLNAAICQGFQLHQRELLYPVHWHNAKVYFETGALPKETRRAYVHHLWNKISHGWAVPLGSPYERLARKHCPTIRTFYGDQFGA